MIVIISSHVYSGKKKRSLMNYMTYVCDNTKGYDDANGTFKGEEVLLPRIPIIPTICCLNLNDFIHSNKSQGQSFNVCVMNLENVCFSHDYSIMSGMFTGRKTICFIYVRA